MADGVFNQPRAYGGITHVAGKSYAVRAGFGNALLRVGGWLRGTVNGNVSSCFSKRNSNGGAESTRGAGNESDFTFQIEFVEYQGNGPFRNLKILISGILRATSLPV